MEIEETVAGEWQEAAFSQKVLGFAGCLEVSKTDCYILNAKQPHRHWRKYEVKALCYTTYEWSSRLKFPSDPFQLRQSVRDLPKTLKQAYPGCAAVCLKDSTRFLAV